MAGYDTMKHALPNQDQRASLVSDSFKAYLTAREQSQPLCFYVGVVWDSRSRCINSWKLSTTPGLKRVLLDTVQASLERLQHSPNLSDTEYRVDNSCIAHQALKDLLTAAGVRVRINSPMDRAAMEKHLSDLGRCLQSDTAPSWYRKETSWGETGPHERITLWVEHQNRSVTR